MGIIGAILGDIAGSKYEFHSFRNWLTEKEPVLWDDKNHEYTDDTVLSIATMEAILNGSLDFKKSYQAYGQKYPTAGYGGAFRCWIYSDGKPYNSWGNGSAMRVSFIGEYYKDKPSYFVDEIAKQSASVTHNHPEGIKGAVVTAHCVWMAENGKNKEEILDYASKWYPSSDYKYGADLPTESYRNAMSFDVSCMGSVPVAIRCFYESEDFESFCKLVCRMTCDTDTLCAIGGAVAHSYYKKCTSNDWGLLANFLDADLFSSLKRHYKK